MQRAAWFGALVALTLVTTPAFAEPPGAALRLYAAGDFLAAADVADDQTSSSSLSFASRALVAACVTTVDHSQIEPLLDRAERSARQALALDDRSVDARLQLALVYGVRGRRASLADAFAHRYAPRGKRLIDQALAIEPDNAHAHALLGAWHLEVIRRGGATGATMYGASLARGGAEFDRARALAPDDPMIPLQYAIALIELDASHNAARAGRLLADVSEMSPRDAFEAHTQRAARRLARALEQEGPRAAERMAREAFL